MLLRCGISSIEAGLMGHHGQIEVPQAEVCLKSSCGPFQVLDHHVTSPEMPSAGRAGIRKAGLETEALKGRDPVSG